MLATSLKNLGRYSKLVLIGSFGAGNVGDELLLAGFLAELQRVQPDVRVTIFSADPAETVRRHIAHQAGREKWRALRSLPTGFHSLFASGASESVAALGAADAVVFPGGGLFTDGETARAVWIWSVPALVAYFWRKPVYFFGQSIGPIGNRAARWLAGAVLARAQFVGVRDAASEPAAFALGVSADRLAVGHDSALFLHKNLKLPRRKKPGTILKIAVSARDFHGLSDKFWHEFASALATLVRLRKLHGREVRVRLTFLPFETGAHDDRATWQKLQKLQPILAMSKLEILPLAPRDLLARLARFDLLIGMRLHSLVAATLSGVSAVGVAYSPKVAEFARQAGQVCFSVDSLNATEVVTAVRKIIQ